MRLLALPTNRIPFPTFPRVAPWSRASAQLTEALVLAASPWAPGAVFTGRGLPGVGFGIVALACLIVLRVDLYVHVSTLLLFPILVRAQAFRVRIPVGG